MSLLPTNRKGEADRTHRCSLENDGTLTYISNVTTVATHTLSGRDPVRQPDKTESSLTDTLGAAKVPNYSKRRLVDSKFSPHLFVWIFLVYYRIYAEDGAIPLKTPVIPGDLYLGRIKARSVPPPRTVKVVKLSIAKAENIKFEDHTSTTLFLTPYSQSPMDDADKVTIINGTGPGSTAQEPLALVAKMSDSERDALESGERSGLTSAAEADTIRYGTSIQHSPTYHLDCWGKCTICSTATIMKCHRKSPLIQTSPPLVESRPIPLLRLILPPRSNDVFRGWKESQDLPTPIFMKTHHAILHWKKATSQYFALMAQVWVRVSQWPSFNLNWEARAHWHHSWMGGMPLKIEQQT